MLSESLDPDQDLQSGFKLFTWYDICCIIRGGGFRPGGDYVLVVKFSGGDYVLVVKFSGGDYVLVVKFSRGDYVLVVKFSGGDYVLVVKFSGGDYVLVVKFSRGDYVLVVKFMGGILSTYTKMSRGGFVRGGLCPYPVLSICCFNFPS